VAAQPRALAANCSPEVNRGRLVASVIGLQGDLLSILRAPFFALVTLLLVSRTIADIGADIALLSARGRGALPMNGSLFAELDRFCGHFALALHNAELQVYAVLTLLLVIGILLFPPRNDPDQA
jgi:hypothetical protein